MFCYEFLNGVFDNFLVGGSWVFVDFGVKIRVRKLANCFLLVEVGAPNDCRPAFVGCFDDEVISVFEIYEGSLGGGSRIIGSLLFIIPFIFFLSYSLFLIPYSVLPDIHYSVSSWSSNFSCIDVASRSTWYSILAIPIQCSLKID